MTKTKKVINRTNAIELAEVLRTKFIDEKCAYTAPMIVTALRQFRFEGITRNKNEQHDEFIVVNRAGNKRLEVNVLHNDLMVTSVFVSIKESF